MSGNLRTFIPPFHFSFFALHLHFMIPFIYLLGNLIFVIINCTHHLAPAYILSLPGHPLFMESCLHVVLRTVDSVALITYIIACLFGFLLLRTSFYYIFLSSIFFGEEREAASLVLLRRGWSFCHRKKYDQMK